jgi:N utilization substance protein B
MATGKGRKKTSEGRRKRTAARLAAVQALYEMELSGAGADPVLGDFMSDRWRGAGAEDGLPDLIEPDPGLLAELVRGVAERSGDIDGMISGALAADLSLDRLQAVLRAVLRAATFELLARPDTPAKVVIDDYMDVAKAFFLGPESSLVNAVLDRLARVLRAPEMEGSGRGGQDDGKTG